MRIRSKTFVIGISRALQQATTLILGIILVRLVTKEVLGTYRQVYLVYMFFAGLISLQIGNTFYYFLPKIKVDKRKGFVFQSVLMTLATATIVSLCLYAGSDIIAQLFKNPELASLLKIFSLVPFFYSFTKLTPDFLISLDKAAYGAIYSFVAAVSRVMMVVCLFAAGLSLLTVVWSIIIVNIILAISGLVLILGMCPGGKWSLDTKLMVSQFNYAWPLLAASVVGILKVQLDKILISSYFNPETYAVYSCGAFEIPVIALVTTSLTMAITPSMVNLLEQKRTEAALSIWYESARKSALIIFPCFTFFMFFGYEVIVLLYGQDYSQASLPFRIYLLTLPARVVMYSTFLRALGKTRPIAVVAVIALIVNAIISVALLFLGRKGTLSFVGPAIGTVCANFVMICLLIGSICRYANLSLNRVLRWPELGRLLAISLGCGVLLWLIPMPIENLFIVLAVRFLIYVAFFFCAMLLTKSFTADERQLMRLPLNLTVNLLKKAGIRNDK